MIGAGRRPGAMAGHGPRGRGRARRRPHGARRLPRLGPRTLAAIVATLALLGGAYLWVRQSSLVAVRRVAIAGASGPQAAQIRSALIAAARTMTTLDVQPSRLHTAVIPYPVVKGLQVSTQFPHGMRIRVIEQVPVADIDVDGRQTLVAQDGTLLQNAPADAALPTITLSVAPGGTRLTGVAGSEVKLLAAAPRQLLVRITQASSDSVHGLVAQLRDGPKVYFGDGAALAAKWRAAAEVLADSRSAGADYIDVTVPSRPAAGTGSDGSGSPSVPGTRTTTTTGQPGTLTVASG